MLKEIWAINTKTRTQLEDTPHVVSDGLMWKTIDGNLIPFAKDNEGYSFIVERYCDGVFVNIRFPKGILRGAINGKIIEHIIPEWACSKITAIDPNIDTEYFI